MSVNLFAKYEMDPIKTVEGVRFDFEGITFIIKPSNSANREYRYSLAIAAQSFMHIFKAEPRDNSAVFAANEEIQQIAFSETVLLGWEGMVGRDGNPLEFSKAAALDLLKSCPTVWDELKGAAIDEDLFKPDPVADGESLGESLSGNSSGGTD